MYIGKKIKEIRQNKRMKLLELARKTGIQIASLSRIENLKMTGTLDSHIKIAEALDIDITQLYAEVISDEKASELKTPQSDTDMFMHSDKSSYEILTNKVLSKKMMPILLKIESGGKTNKEQNSAASERFIYVLDGEIEAKIKGETFKLKKGHSLYFKSSYEHFFVNKGKKTAKVISVISPVAL